MSLVVCLNCGSDETAQVDESRAGPVAKQTRKCPHCDAQGRVFKQTKMGTGESSYKVLSGDLAVVSREGAELLKENMDFTPVYQQ